MANDFKKQPGAPEESHGAYRGLKGLFVLWDMSRNPKKATDLINLVGKADKVKGMGIADYDEATRGITYMDGLAKGDTPASAHFDPHNWVLRLMDSKGRGESRFWQHRTIVEHVNRAGERKHRSNIFVDACDEQNWAFAQDAFWIIALGAGVQDAELHFDKAGFLPLVTGKNKQDARKTRGALAFNMNLSAGYLTDGLNVGQMYHVLHLSPLGGAGSTVITPSKCGTVNRAQTTLRGDAIFHVGPDLADFNYGKKATVGCNPYMGHFAIDTARAPLPPNTSVGKDVTSNQPVLPRRATKSIRPVVRIRPESKNVPTGAPPIGIPVATPGAVPDNTAEPAGLPAEAPQIALAGSSPPLAGSLRQFRPGKFVGVYGFEKIPSLLLEEMFARVEVGLTVPNLPTGGTTYKFALTYRAQFEDSTTSSPFKQLTVDVPAADLGVGSFLTIGFDIPAADIENRNGGTIWLGFYQLSTSTGDKPIQFRGPTILWPTPGPIVQSTVPGACYGTSSPPGGYP